MKETYYFSHDYNARSDPKLRALMAKMGLDGLGIYWCIIEMLYEQDGYLKLDSIESIAFELHSECDRINSVLKNFGLFKFKKDLFYSESVLRRISVRKNKSNINRINAITRWNRVKNSDATALRPHEVRNAIKVNDIKENKNENKEQLVPDFVAPNFSDPFRKWMEHKKGRKESYKSLESEKAFYNRLIKLSNNNPNTAAEIVDLAMANNWGGIYALKNENNKNNSNTQQQPYNVTTIKHDAIINPALG